MDSTAFLSGFVGGAFQGAQGALSLQNDAIAVRQKRRAEEAAKEVGILFEDAAKAGGLGKVGDDWFTKVSTALAGAGDPDAALKFAEYGNRIKAERVKSTAQAAWSLLGVGDYEGAVPLLNEMFNEVGGTFKLGGVGQGQDGAPVVLSEDGRQVPASSLMAAVERFAMSPSDAIQLMIERAKGQAYVQAQQASATRDLAAAESTSTLLPYRIQEAQAGASRDFAAAAAERSAMARAAQLLPSQLRKAGAEAASAELGLKLDEDTYAASVEKARSDAAIAAERAKIADKLAAAEIRGNQPSPTAAASDAMQLYDAMIEGLEARYTGMAAGQAPPEAITDLASPVLRRAVQRRLVETATANPSLGGAELIGLIAGRVDRVRNMLVNANPELASEPELLADLMALLVETPEVDVETDEIGTYLVEPALGDRRIYLNRGEPADE